MESVVVVKALQRSQGNIYGAAALILASAPPTKRQRTGVATERSIGAEKEVDLPVDVIKSIAKDILMETDPEQLQNAIHGIKMVFDLYQNPLFDFRAWYETKVRPEYRFKHFNEIKVTWEIDGVTYSGPFSLYDETGATRNRYNVLLDLARDNEALRAWFSLNLFGRLALRSYLKGEKDNPEKLFVNYEAPMLYFLKAAQYENPGTLQVDFVYLPDEEPQGKPVSGLRLLKLEDAKEELKRQILRYEFIRYNQPEGDNPFEDYDHYEFIRDFVERYGQPDKFSEKDALEYFTNEIKPQFQYL